MDSLREDISSAIEQVREQVSDNNQSDQGEEGARPSVRDSIKAAFDEHRDDDVSENNPRERTLEKSEELSLDKLPERFRKFKLGPDVAKEIMEREAEIQQGEAQLKERFKPWEEIEKVIEPRKEFFNRSGVSPAQAVDRLFQWLDHLSHPDIKVREGALIQLAKNYGVDVTHPDFSKPEQPSASRTQGDPILMAKWNNQLAEVRKTYPDFDVYWPLAQRFLVSKEFHTKDKDKFFGFDVLGALDEAKNVLNSRANKRKQDLQKAIDASRAAKPKPRASGMNKKPLDTSVRRFIKDAIAVAQKG